MKYMKVFRTSDMPPDIFKYIMYSGSFVPDGYGAYTVGAFVKEVDESDGSAAYDTHDYERAKRADLWFLNNGASRGETILIEHG